MVKKKYGMWMEIIYGIVLVAFTIYMLLDTFVLSEKVTVVDSAQTASVSQNTTGNNTKTSTTYEDDNIKITLTDYRENVNAILAINGDY